MNNASVQVESKKISREVFVGLVSSMVEAYNMAIYIFMAPLLSSLLFKGSTEGSAIFFPISLSF